jgi:protocatechuate 3,4-dioxygenase beta subunit
MKYVISSINNKKLFAMAVMTVFLFGYTVSSAGADDSSVKSVDNCSGRLTSSLTAGPYYKTGSPERSSLIEPGIQGEALVITGTVYNRDCKPISGVWLDFWQADGMGRYDNRGYRLRGHLYTDSSGDYYLETVVPAEYQTRTPHIHVKLRTPKGTMLTTQLFLPGEARNKSDRIFHPDLVMGLTEKEEGKFATFDFIINEE